MSNMNATAQIVQATGLAGAGVLSSTWSLFMSVQTEVFLFVTAMVAYMVLFSMQPKITSKSSKVKGKREAKSLEQECAEKDYPMDTSATSKVAEPGESPNLGKVLDEAFENGDYLSVLQCWNILKNSETMPVVSLSRVVETMQRFKKDTPFILLELKRFLTKFPDEVGMPCINNLLESLAKRLDSELLEKLAEMLPSFNLHMDERSYEIFLNMYFTTRGFEEVKALVSQMKETHITFTPRSSMVVIKTALKTHSLDDAIQHFRELKSTWSAQSLSSTASVAPSHIVSQLVELACKDHKLNEFISELSGVPVSEEAVNTMLLECIRQRDLVLTSAVEKLAKEQTFTWTDTTYGLLIRGMAADPIHVQAIFKEVVAKDIKITSDFATSVLAYCTQTSNAFMADKLYEHMKPTQLSVLAAFVRFYADCEEFEKACDIYEHDLLRLHGTIKEPVPECSGSIQMDARMERSLMNAALKCGRPHLATNLLSASPSDVAKHITMIRNFAAERNLQGAVRVFDSLERSGVDMNSVIYNTVLDACVECRDLKAAEAWMEQTKKAGMADVVSFNTLTKAYLQNGNLFKARFLIHEMKKLSIQPNRVTFNELINAMVSRGGGDSQKMQMWDLVDEMMAADVKPNQVTVSILLKNLNSRSGESEITKTMDLINTMDEDIDEVLLSSVVEACVRIGKPDLLESQLNHLQGKGIAINGSHTYGSLIKAYGHAKNVDGIWRCWKEMRSRHIKPTSITLGCMVEAIVNNGDSEGAYDLIHQIQKDENCRGALNSVIYCSVLKGFAREKKMERVLAVYEEIGKERIELSIIMYNTLIDACARCYRMEVLPKILEDMKTAHVMPNLITYSTMLKGHCQNGDMETAFSILEQMKTDAHLMPDEIMYNSLLDGCAQNSLVNEGLHILDKMQSEGVKPSNFTLSLLVKLMNRARRLDQAFSIVEEITHKYQFHPNVHVYGNLVQACVSNQQLARGITLLEKMVKEQITPDGRTYTILVRASISRGLFQQAVGLLRGALGLKDALPFLQQSVAVCWNLDTALVNEALSSIADYGHAHDLAAPLLASIEQQAPKVRIDPATQRKVLSPSPTSSSIAGKGKGNGKGKGSWGRQ